MHPVNNLEQYFDLFHISNKPGTNYFYKHCIVYETLAGFLSALFLSILYFQFAYPILLICLITLNMQLVLKWLPGLVKKNILSLVILEEPIIFNIV
jgi:hypothetical protein